ncbi:MAG: amino acid ABC transporter substrate-binding protein [Desulfobacterales bacterium]|nr:amino acid ABC transporter substrate-binding protein [Desulfobacterales bacterium]MCP4160536.1 amino acid ABC transporter substrate-binding protein [Deltaproteobacteria bacterium]
MKKNKILILFVYILLCTHTLSGKELVVAFDHWPPRRIVTKTSFSGIDAEIIQNIAAHLKLEVRFVECPWARCLYMLELGQVDIISGLLKSPEREKYIHYINPPYLKKSTKVFYLPKGKGHLIKKYEDLYKLSDIGVAISTKYFPRFDADSRISKYKVANEVHLLRMLSLKRLPAIIGTERIMDYMIHTEGFSNRFQKAPFRYDKENLVYFGISKKSFFSKQLLTFEKLIQEMIENKEIDKIVKKYTQKN